MGPADSVTPQSVAVSRRRLLPAVFSGLSVPAARAVPAVPAVVTYLARRLLSSLVTLIGVSLVAYFAAASIGANGGVVFDLPANYFIWLSQLLRGDFGTSWVNMGNFGARATTSNVMPLVLSGLQVTLHLVARAWLLAITVGVSIGIISAVRQYSRFDYWASAFTFVLFSIPPFVAAYFSQLYGAITFNNWFSQTVTNSSIFRLMFWQPQLGYLGIALLGAGFAYAVVRLTTDAADRRALYAALTAVLVMVVLRFPLLFLFVRPGFGWAQVAILAGGAAAIGLAIGWLFGRKIGAKRVTMRAASLTALFCGGLIFLDRLVAVWPHYLALRHVNYRPLPTFGFQRPGVPNDFWFRLMDQHIHLFLPTLALSIISIATYARYTRASLGEVLNQEYVRTARAKGLSEPLVVFRHVFRNALIPLTTIVPLDFAGLLGGAMVIEVIFSLRGGLSGVFLNSLHYSQAEGITYVFFPDFSGYLLVIGLVLVAANFVVDLAYTALDPRIRVH